MGTEDKLAVIEVCTRGTHLPVLEELLGAQDLKWASWWNPETQAAVARIYFDDASTREPALRHLREVLRDCSGLFAGDLPSLQTCELRREDWANIWKQYFHVFRASDRLVVKPTWESYEAAAGDIVLELDPGMSFGTGYHGTTRACLEYLDELEREVGPVSLLDAGCGSGILSLAAAKLGFRPVIAFDHDPDAVRVARENLESAMEERVQVFCADVGAAPVHRGFRVVVANILAPVLQRHARNLVGYLEQRGGGGCFLVLSGILESQYAETKEIFERHGVVERSCKVHDEWQTGCFVLHSSQTRFRR